LWVGAAFSKNWRESEDLGITVYYTSRSMTQTIAERSYNSSTDYEIYSEEKTVKQNAIVFVLGYLKTINESWKWGISFRPPSLQIAGSATYTESKITNGTLAPPVDQPDLSSRAQIPPRLAVGFSYNNLDKWLWAVDVTVHGPVNYDDVQ